MNSRDTERDLPRLCDFYSLGLTPYETAWLWQKEQVAQRRQQPGRDQLLLLEHPPTYTLGQGASEAHLRFPPDNPPAPLLRIERGGEVTYHCPGQLVGYPILNLRDYRTDLHWYLRQLEEVLLQTLAHYDLPGERIPGLTGVWIAGVKVGAIGIKVSRWITMHGFSLNVCPDLAGFAQIVPCGISDRRVGRLVDWCPGLTVAEVQPVVAAAFANVFQVKLRPVDNLC